MFKQLVKNSFIYVVLGFLPPAVNFFLAPLYTQYLSPDQFGLIALGTLVQAVATNVVALGLDGAFSRYFFEYYKDKKKLEHLFSTTTISVLIFGVLVFLALLLVGEPLLNIAFKNDVFTYFDYAIFSVITGIFTILQSVILIYYRNKEQPLKYGVFSLISFFMIAGSIVIGVVILEQEALGSIVGRAIGILVPTSLFLIIHFAKYGVALKVKLLPKLLRYGLPLMPYLLLGFLFNSLDKLLIERFFDLNELGLYNFAFLVASAVSIFISSMQSAINPRIYKELTDDKPAEHIGKLYDFLLVSTSVIIVLILAVVNPAIVTFIDVRYHEVVIYLPLLIVSFVPRIYYITYSVPIFFHKKTKILPLINFISLVIGFATAYLLIQQIGIFGVVIAVFLIKLIQFVSTLLYVQHSKLHVEGLSNIRAHSIPLFILVYTIGVYLFADRLVAENIFIWANIPLLFIVGVYILIKYKSLILRNSKSFNITVKDG